MAFVSVWRLQRRDDSLSDRDHAGEGAHSGIFTRVQFGDGYLRRIYPRDQHVSHSYNRKSRRARDLAIVCGGLCAAGVASGPTLSGARSAGSPTPAGRSTSLVAEGPRWHPLRWCEARGHAHPLLRSHLSQALGSCTKAFSLAEIPHTLGTRRRAELPSLSKTERPSLQQHRPLKDKPGQMAECNEQEDRIAIRVNVL